MSNHKSPKLLTSKLQSPVVHTQKTQEQRLKLITDLKHSPLYKNEIEGQPELEAIVSQCPESEIIRLANLSRDPKDPFSFGNKVLLDMTIKKSADLTEIQYWLSVLRKRDFPRDELLNLHEKA